MAAPRAAVGQASALRARGLAPGQEACRAVLVSECASSCCAARGAIASAIFKRVDTGKSVRITYANSMVPPDPDMQARVKAVLLGDLEGMFSVETL